MERILKTILHYNYHAVIFGGANSQLQLFNQSEDEKPIAITHRPADNLFIGLLEQEYYYNKDDFDLFMSRYKALKGGE